jgi:hypothetical protein
MKKHGAHYLSGSAKVRNLAYDFLNNQFELGITLRRSGSSFGENVEANEFETMGSVNA